MKKKSYIFIAVIAVLASFMLQVVWVNNVLDYTRDKIRQDLDGLLVNGMFEELNQRSSDIPEGTELRVLGPEGDYSGIKQFKYVNESVCSLIHKDVNLDSLSFIMKRHLAEDSINYDFVLYKIEKGKKVQSLYNGNHKPILVLFCAASSIVPININDSIGIQIELLNINDYFIKDSGIIIISSFIILLLLIWCIAKQVSLIRIQRKTMQMRKDFTYAMVHDMKTPLSTIILGMGFLEQEKVDNDKELKGKYHRILKDEAQRLMGLVSKILTISKLEEGKLEMNKEEVELLPMIEDLEEKFTTKATKPLTFRNNIEAGTVFADAEYFGEAISNLIDNAIKYSKDNIEIEVSSKMTAAGTVISVRDNGIGISKKDQKVIFDKFERASASGRTFKKNGPSGFGLGLNYVLQVIEAHGGIVGVDSEVGKYSEFTLLLPKGNEE